MEQEKENIYNIPNLLSFYRLVAFPLVLFLVLTGREHWFSILLCVNLVTDILDGLIARTFHLQTRFGARLDSLADIGTYILALMGVFTFKWGQIAPDAGWIWAFLAVYFIAYAVSFAKFRKFPSLHLYSCKIGGYIQGIFFFILFFSGYHAWMFIVAMASGVVCYSEETLVLLLLPEMRSNARGLLWVTGVLQAAPKKP